MAEELQVFGFWSSPFSLRVELALKLKGIRYQYIEEDVMNKKSDLLLKYNSIYKNVPVLVHHGKPISESLVILEYIDENWRENYPILPQHPHQRALARVWAKYIDDKVVPAIVKAVGSKGEEMEKAVEEVKGALEPLEKELKIGNKLLGGERIGFVDIVGTAVACWLPAIEEALRIELLTTHKFPNPRLWSEELSNHNVVKELLPKKDEVVAFVQAIFFPRINGNCNPYQKSKGYLQMYKLFQLKI